MMKLFLHKWTPLASLVICCALSYSAWGQNTLRASFDSIMSLDLSKEQRLELARDLIKDSISYTSLDQATVFYDLAKAHWPSQKQKSIAYGQRAHAILQDLSDVHPDWFSRNAFNLGLFHKKLTFPDYTTSLRFYDLVTQNYETFEVRAGNAYREKGDIYSSLGDVGRALDNYYQSVVLLDKNQSHKNLLKTYINISATLAELQDLSYYDDFEENQRRLTKLTEQIPLSESQTAKLLLNNAIMQSLKSEAPIHTERLFNQALAIASQLEDKDLAFLCYNGLGVFYNRNKQFDKAFKVYEFAKILAYQNPRYISGVHNNMGDIYLAQGQFEPALEQYQQAIQALLGAQTSQDLKSLPTIVSLELNPFLQDILGYLIDKANAWLAYYNNNPDTNFLEAAQQTFDLADAIVDILYTESRESLSKMFWRKKGGEFYSNAVAVSYLQNDLDRAFYFIEKNKGLLLLDNIASLKAKNSSAIPKHILEREFSLKSEINRLKLALSYQDKTEQTVQSRDSIRKRLFAAKGLFTNFVDSLASQYKAYSYLKEPVNILSRIQVENSLKPNERILNYIVGKSQAFVMYITPNGSELKAISDVNGLKQDVDAFNKHCHSPMSTLEDQDSFYGKGSKLYQLLFPFKEFRSGMTSLNLAIVTDGFLQNLPFEAIPFQKSKHIERDYLLNAVSIAYRFSNSIAHNSVERQVSFEQDFVSLAPGVFENSYLPALLTEDLGGAFLANELDGNVLRESQASLSNFINSYNNAAIVHVSSHGGIDDRGPWLATYDRALSLDELYFKSAPTELVVLSACKTQIGEHFIGEGAFTIARSFKNAGAKNIISTLWEINEKSSQEVIASFYKNTFEGTPKASALQQAKLAYLKKHQNTSLASPYYWAGVVLNGDNLPLAIDNTTPLWPWVLLVIAILGLLFWRFRRSR
ncbi:MAG: CHAT domain-containing tetratricopeptide repeat protein [Gilvibacter sp.]